jgi:hypothetical protein
MEPSAPAAPPSLYERDFARWLADHADAVRERRWDAIDAEALGDELEVMSRLQQRKLLNRLRSAPSWGSRLRCVRRSHGSPHTPTRTPAGKQPPRPVFQ